MSIYIYTYIYITYVCLYYRETELENFWYIYVYIYNGFRALFGDFRISSKLFWPRHIPNIPGVSF